MFGKSINEKKLLWISVIAALIFALVGIVWGIAISSQIILFDGAYSFISVLLSLMSLIVARYIQQSDAARFPYGKEMLEPLVIIVKYTIILVLCITAILAAIESLTSGGREVSIGHALVFAAISTIGCAAVYWMLNRHKKNSGFIRAEANQWKMDTLLSAAVLFGFAAAWVVSLTPYRYLMPYVDPIMVLLVVGYFLKTPIREITKSFKEVLEMTPDRDIETEFKTAVQAIESRYQIPESIVRVAKVGNKLFIDVDFILGPQSKIVTTVDQDEVRAEITRNTSAVGYKKWLTVSFTHDAKWAKKTHL